MASGPLAAATPRALLALGVLGAAATTAVCGRSRGTDTTDLTGRTAVVTGGGSGIGRALCLLLGRRAAAVHVVDRDGDAAQAVADEVRRAGGRAEAHRVDVTDAAAVEALAADVAGDGVDLLFNNAGIGHAGLVAETPLEDWRAVVDVNLLGVVHGLHAFLPRLLAQGRPAHVVNTASLAGLVPAPGLVPYSATKWAVVGVSRGLDRELAGSRVRVHALCPGAVDTGIVRSATMRGDWAQAQPELVRRFARRATSPDVVARAALDGVARGRAVIPVPRYQVVPPWLVERLAPGASGAVVRRVVRGVAAPR